MTQELVLRRDLPPEIPDDVDDPPVIKARGVVRLPLWIDWSSTDPTYDLADRCQRTRVYEQVLREGTADDVRFFIDIDVPLGPQPRMTTCTSGGRWPDGLTSFGEFGRAIARGAAIRVVVADPADDHLMEAIARGWRRDAPDDVRRRITATLRELASVRDAHGPGSLQVRVLRVAPHRSVNMVDPDSDTGVLVQHYEYQAAGEPGPIWTLTPRMTAGYNTSAPRLNASRVTRRLST